MFLGAKLITFYLTTKQIWKKVSSFLHLTTPVEIYAAKLHNTKTYKNALQSLFYVLDDKLYQKRKKTRQNA